MILKRKLGFNQVEGIEGMPERRTACCRQLDATFHSFHVWTRPPSPAVWNERSDIVSGHCNTLYSCYKMNLKTTLLHLGVESAQRERRKERFTVWQVMMHRCPRSIDSVTSKLSSNLRRANSVERRNCRWSLESVAKRRVSSHVVYLVSGNVSWLGRDMGGRTKDRNVWLDHCR